MGNESYIAQSIITSIDFDGVLAHGLALKLKYAKKWFGVDLSLDQTKEKGFNALMKKIGRTDLNYRSLMDPINEKHILEYQIPQDCINVLTKAYQEGFRFVVITSRGDHDYPYAKLFLQERFEGLIKNIHKTDNKSKDKFVKKLTPRIHIDDDLYKLQELKHLPLELVYFRQPENIGIEMPLGERKRIQEATTFKEIEAILQNMKETHEAICWKYKIVNKYSNIAKIFTYSRSLTPTQLRELIGEYRTIEKQAQAA